MFDDDDAERLVEADALLAKGDLRGELIVIQCELARGGFSRERGISLRKRELDLLLRHENVWAGLDDVAHNWTFRRGFVDEITITAKHFADYEDTIWRLAPRLRWVNLTGLNHTSMIPDLQDPAFELDKILPRLEAVFASGRVRYVGVAEAQVTWEAEWQGGTYVDRASFSPAIAGWLVRQPQILGRLRGLVLGESDSFEELASSDAAAGIEEITLVGRMSAWPKSKLQPRRARLVHFRARMQDDQGLASMRAVLSTPFASRLTDLQASHFSTSFACAPQLRSLELTRCEDLEEIVNARELTSLEHLGFQLFDRDTEPFFTAKGLDSLRTLRLGSGVTIAAARRLLRSPLAQRLEEIDLRNSSAALEPHIHELRTLWDGFLLL